MCGIFGYIGREEKASEFVLSGLKLLEYRGYDSWGVAVSHNSRFLVEKNVGKIDRDKTSLPPSRVGIGHTRWATHGGVTIENAHPHLDCTKNIALVHNGIVENYQDVKKPLLASHTFLSETDSEVIVHQIEEFSKDNTFSEAVRKAFLLCHGLNAIVVSSVKDNVIVAAKNGSPIVIGKKDHELFLASDVSGILKHTKEVYFLKDGEMIILADEAKLVSIKTGTPLPLEFETITWDIKDADIGDYKHFMLKEIHDQPQVIRTIAKTKGDEITLLAKTIGNAQGTFFIGAGTAYHASLAGAYWFSKIAKIHVNTQVASEFNYLEDFLNEKSLIIAFSQSGETIDVIEPLTRAKEKGSTIAAIVNSIGSTIYRMADQKILLDAGVERAVASTKAYIAKAAIMYLLVQEIVDKRADAESELLAVADEVERLIAEKANQQMQTLANVLKDTEHIYVIGRGLSYASSMEAALKIKEISYIHTEGLAGGELKHGTLALISQGTPVIVFAPNDDTYAAMISNATEIKARGGMIIGIGPKKEDIFDEWIEVKDLGEASMIAQIVPIQLLAYYLAVVKNLDPDKPRNLAKSVTVK